MDNNIAKHDGPARLIIGLTGAIGAGKSLVADIFAELGCDVIDADKCGHAVLTRPDIISRITDCFGDEVLGADGSIDRSKLAGLAFVNEDSVNALNSIVHPAMAEQMKFELARLGRKDSGNPIIIDAALLLETEWWQMCDTIVFVDCPYEIRLRRVCDNRGWDEKELAKREKFHISLDTKRTKAHNVLVNSSSESDLREQVCLLHHRLNQRYP